MGGGRGCQGVWEGQKEVWARRGQEGWGEGRGSRQGLVGQMEASLPTSNCPVPPATLKDDRPQDWEQHCTTWGQTQKKKHLKTSPE